MADVHGWDTNSAGKLEAFPVLGWDTRTAQLIGLLRLRYARSETEFETGGVALQVHLTPVQLRQLASDLLQTADRIDELHLGSRQ